MATGGDVIAVEDVRLDDQDTSITVFHALTDAYIYTLDKYISNRRLVRVQVEDEQFEGDGMTAKGTFLIDNTLGINTTLTVLFNTRSDIGYVRLRAPGGIMRDVYTYPDSTNHLMYAPVPQTVSEEPERPLGERIDRLHVVGIYHFLKAHNFPEFLGCHLKTIDLLHIKIYIQTSVSQKR